MMITLSPAYKSAPIVTPNKVSCGGGKRQVGGENRGYRAATSLKGFLPGYPDARWDASFATAGITPHCAASAVRWTLRTANA